MDPIDLDLGLKGTHVLLTGGAGLIGVRVLAALLAAGANVTCADLEIDVTARLGRQLHVAHFSQLYCLRLDVTNESEVVQGFELARKRFGPVLCCVCLAGKDLSVLEHRSVVEMEVEQWRETLEVNSTGTFLTVREWLRGLKMLKDEEGVGLRRNVGCVLMGSESGSFGERLNADYASSKAAVQVGLLQSLRADVPRVYEGARANAVAPGPVDTERFREECKEDPNQLYFDAQATVALRRPVPTESVARSILYLASETWSGSVHGQILSVDSGKFGKVMWERHEVVA